MKVTRGKKFCRGGAALLLLVCLLLGGCSAASREEEDPAGEPAGTEAAEAADVPEITEISETVEEEDDADESADEHAEEPADESVEEPDEEPEEGSAGASEEEEVYDLYDLWQEALSDGNEYDVWESIGDNYSHVKDLIDRGWVYADDVTTYLDLVLGTEQRSGDNAEDFNRLTELIGDTGYCITDFFTYDSSGRLVSDGLINLIEVLASVSDDEYPFAVFDDDGGWSVDLSAAEMMEEASRRVGISTDLLQWFLVALQDVTENVELNK